MSALRTDSPTLRASRRLLGAVLRIRQVAGGDTVQVQGLSLDRGVLCARSQVRGC